MYLSGKFSDLFLLFSIKFPLVSTVRNYCLPELATGQVMQNQTFFTGIDHSSVIQFFKFFCQTAFVSQCPKLPKHSIIDLFCSIAIEQSGCHRYLVSCYSDSAFFTGQFFLQIHRMKTLLQFLIAVQFVKIDPSVHVQTSAFMIGLILNHYNADITDFSMPRVYAFSPRIILITITVSAISATPTGRATCQSGTKPANKYTAADTSAHVTAYGSCVFT